MNHEILGQCRDPFMRFARDYPPRIGCTVIDEMRFHPGPSLVRAWETGQKVKRLTFPRNPEEILCRGAAAGQGTDGRVTHFWPDRGFRFAGFIEGNVGDRVEVAVRGAVTLLIPDASEDDRGAVVYCDGPNSFSLRQTAGAVEIGRIRLAQGPRASVAFKRADDQVPLDLVVGVN